MCNQPRWSACAGLTVVDRGRGLKRRPLPSRPIPGYKNSINKEERFCGFRAYSFRLIPHWNRTAISGSLRVGNEIHFQAHFWIGKCSNRPKRRRYRKCISSKPSAASAWGTARGIGRDLAQPSIVISAAPNVAYRELSGLPSTIRIGSGKLEITCIDARDPLRRLMELAQASGGTLV